MGVGGERKEIGSRKKRMQWNEYIIYRYLQRSLPDLWGLNRTVWEIWLSGANLLQQKNQRLTSLQFVAYLKTRFLGKDASAWMAVPPSAPESQGWSFTMYVHFSSKSASGHRVMSASSMSIFMVPSAPSTKVGKFTVSELHWVAAWKRRKKPLIPIVLQFLWFPLRHCD